MICTRLPATINSHAPRHYEEIIGKSADQRQFGDICQIDPAFKQNNAGHFFAALRTMGRTFPPSLIHYR